MEREEKAPEILPTWRHPDTPLKPAAEIVPAPAHGPLPPGVRGSYDLPADEE